MSPDEPYAYATCIVRVFPDDASSVIWFGDPVPYVETRLSPELVDALERWA